jgi:NDP-sugar pyrophosphorylase family protein
MKNTYKDFVRNPEMKRPLELLCVGGRTILEWILEEHGGKV